MSVDFIGFFQFLAVTVGNAQIGGAHLAQLRIIDSAVHVDLATVPIVGLILQQLALDHGHHSPPALG